MNHIPEFTMLGIDPGGNMGICIARVNPRQQTLTVLEAFTLVMDDCIKVFPEHLHSTLDKRSLIDRYLTRKLTNLLEHYAIDHVVYEAAYNSRSLIAYDSLMFYGGVIRKVVTGFDFDLSVESVAPSKVKSSIGVKGNSGDKDAVRRAVASCNAIELTDGVTLAELTEHAVDAIAIAHYAFKECIQQLPPSIPNELTNPS